METLNHIIIYNVVFRSVSIYYIHSTCCMTSNVQMAMLHFNMNCICNKLLLCCALNPTKHPKTTKLNPNTPWMKQNYKKTTNIDCFYYLPSMNHFRFMEIQYSCQFYFSIRFSGLLILVFNIPCHLQLSCICKTCELDHLL
jgi:hypothetical protein